MKKISADIQKKLLVGLSLTLMLAVITAYQNCSEVDLVSSEKAKAICDPSAYDITRDVTATDGNAVYFLRQTNQSVSHEYIGDIEWLVNGIPQSQNVIHGNRLFLNCDSHPEDIQITARFVTDCGEEVVKIEDFSYPADICETLEPPTPSPVPPAGEVDYCEEYKNNELGPIGTPERDHFEAYNAENRGLSRDISNRRTTLLDYTVGQTYNYQRQTWLYDTATKREIGAIGTLGMGGSFSPHASRGSSFPGYLSEDKYLALEFTLRPVSTCTGKCISSGDVLDPVSYVCTDGVGTCEGTGKFKMDFYTVGAREIKTHPVAISISPCKGDFRPQDNNSSDAYLHSSCRNLYDDSHGADFMGNGTSGCPIPVGKKVYINGSLRDLFQPGRAYPLNVSSILPLGQGCYVEKCTAGVHKPVSGTEILRESDDGMYKSCDTHWCGFSGKFNSCWNVNTGKIGSCN